MLQGHCTDSNVTCHMSAVTATVTTGTVTFGRHWKMPETAEFLSVAWTQRKLKSIPGSCSGHWKCSIAKCSSLCIIIIIIIHEFHRDASLEQNFRAAKSTCRLIDVEFWTFRNVQKFNNHGTRLQRRRGDVELVGECKWLDRFVLLINNRIEINCYISSKQPSTAVRVYTRYVRQRAESSRAPEQQSARV